MSFQPWLEFIGVLSGSVFGAYLAVRVTLARIEEKIRAQAETLKDHGERISWLERSRSRGD